MSTEPEEPIITAQTEHLEELLTMALDLWPDQNYEDLKTVLLKILSSDRFKVFLFRWAEEFVGFIYLGIRTDYVEGSESSPTGYVEGIYVKPAFRRKGISRKLLQVGEDWVKENNCTQIGSDTSLDNTVSYHFHSSVGFKESSRVIAFIKDLK
ncbi:GNAT family N-acetyltransferase [Adhaeribacter arboris]|uniref:Aminoglycoside N(6')-acetyltransferase type 1 n=1 Tax=Adhaeribacter arboris TaxID=2072846 RepID=A0A2T2YER2_9BACT|nr:aminoglycoside 6'-N-acetyltransferase [Adhaeribacter arboris]PSR54005.1 GNAT family N-acetyltransferase [Adhaeribacter arboris]